MALADYTSFEISSMTSDQSANGLVIDFCVISHNFNADYTVHCRTEWNDTISQCGRPGCGAPPTHFNPAGFVYNCDNPGFVFELDSYISIAHFSLFVTQTVNYSLQASPGMMFRKRDLTLRISTVSPYETILRSVSYDFTNETAAYTCTEDPINGIHCSAGRNVTLAIASATPGCDAQANINVGFAVQERTNWGDNVFVSGSIPELGNWDPSNAYPMNADQYTDDNPLWFGGFAYLPAGLTFEYKYIQWAVDGTLVWECDENRVYTVPSDSCGLEYVGDDPDSFRGCTHRSSGAESNATLARDSTNATAQHR